MASELPIGRVDDQSFVDAVGRRVARDIGTMVSVHVQSVPGSHAMEVVASIMGGLVRCRVNNDWQRDHRPVSTAFTVAERLVNAFRERIHIADQLVQHRNSIILLAKALGFRLTKPCPNCADVRAKRLSNESCVQCKGAGVIDRPVECDADVQVALDWLHERDDELRSMQRDAALWRDFQSAFASDSAARSMVNRIDE